MGKQLATRYKPAEVDLIEKRLAETTDLDEIKDIRDKAAALVHYAKTAKLKLREQNTAAKVKIDAERRAGELLKEADKNPGGQAEHESYRSHDVTTRPPKLSDIGINKVQSSRWQLEWELPKQLYDEYCQKVLSEGKKELTSEVKETRQRGGGNG